MAIRYTQVQAPAPRVPQQEDNPLLQALSRVRGSYQPNAMMPGGGAGPQQSDAPSAQPSYTPAASPAPSDDFTRWVMGQEGFRDRPYGDYRQTSIGYGTRALPGETSITREEAERRFGSEWSTARDAVSRFAPNLNPGQMNALTDLTFNAGNRWMQSGLGNAVRAGDWQTAQNLFRQYINAGGQPHAGLIARRNAAAPLLGY